MQDESNNDALLYIKQLTHAWLKCLYIAIAFFQKIRSPYSVKA